MYVQSQSAYLEGRAVSGQGVKAYGNAEVELDSFLNLGTVWRRIISFRSQPPLNSPVASSTPLKRKKSAALVKNRTRTPQYSSTYSNHCTDYPT